MNLTCPACGAPFSADDVHVDAGIANCRVCRGVLDLRAPDRPIERARPQRFSVDESDGRLVVEWRWWTWSKLGLVFVVVFWWLILVGWYAGALTEPHVHPVALLFPLLHVGVGVVALYAVIANLLNRTRIVADDERLAVSHGPVPWIGNTTLRRTAIAQLYCCRREPSRHGGAFTYAVLAVDTLGGHCDLVCGFRHPEEARWLEEALEKRLGVRNRPVVGELA